MSHSAQPGLAELSELLKRKTELLERLEKVLDEESKALCSGGHEEVPKLAEQKHRLAMEIVEIGELLHQLVGESGYTPDADGLADCIKARADGDLLALFDAVRRTALDCRRRNEANGSLVERRRAAVGRALRVLFDRPECRGGRYHRSGAMEGVAEHRLIAEV